MRRLPQTRRVLIKVPRIKILITAGPTLEPIDPVRFISNRSTGYMGYKIAKVAAKRRHSVTLITGPTKLKPPKVKKFIQIETAKELFGAIKRELGCADCLIMCAAVADFRPKKIASKKIKRGKGLSLRLIPNKDIVSAISKNKKDKLFIGFSLETENLIRNAYKKLKVKNLDLIVANSLSKRHNPFGDNELSVSIIEKSGHRIYIKGKSKAYIAQVLLDKIERLWYLKKRDA